MTLEEALQFVIRHGIVTESARGPVPSLTEAIAGAAIPGSWWSHPRAREIFRLTRAVRDHPDVLVCRLIGGKVTYVHRPLWGALVRLASGLPASALAEIREIHTPSGKHIVREMPFPAWVPPEVLLEAQRLNEDQARAALAALFVANSGTVASSQRTKPPSVRRSRRDTDRGRGHR